MFSDVRYPRAVPKGVLAMAKWGITPSVHLATDYIYPTPRADAAA